MPPPPPPSAHSRPPVLSALHRHYKLVIRFCLIFARAHAFLNAAGDGVRFCIFFLIDVTEARRVSNDSVDISHSILVKYSANEKMEKSSVIKDKK